ncbi:MAG: hypothetical protein M3M96_03005 [Candidatus Eremiobacteraeota bacterium]|nr:hypothetical protein [Candidatus Eremiobacteraeota bacterium]
MRSGILWLELLCASISLVYWRRGIPKSAKLLQAGVISAVVSVLAGVVGWMLTRNADGTAAGLPFVAMWVLLTLVAMFKEVDPRSL